MCFVDPGVVAFLLHLDFVHAGVWGDSEECVGAKEVWRSVLRGHAANSGHELLADIRGAVPGGSARRREVDKYFLNLIDLMQIAL